MRTWGHEEVAAAALVTILIGLLTTVFFNWQSIAFGLLTVAIAVAVIKVIQCSASSGQISLARASSGDLYLAAIHEGGHVLAAQKGGAKVKKARIDANGGGQVCADFPEKTAKQLKKAAVATVAGRMAEVQYLMQEKGYSRSKAMRETAAGSAHDLALFEQEYAGVITEDAANRRALSLLAANSRKHKKLAQKLNDNGSLGFWDL